MLVRDFTCDRCGAPRKTVEHALVVLCVHCGAMITFAGDRASFAEQHAAGVKQIVNPSAAEARLLALNLELAHADRETWRLLFEEHLLLSAIVGGSPVPDARRLAEQVELGERAMFDLAVRAHLDAYNAAAAKLTLGDAVAAAQEMLVAARAYTGKEHLAKDMVRGLVGGYASLLPVGTIERIRTEVLGDATDGRCARCGGPLAAGTAACRHCGAVATLSTEDAWLAAQLDLWAITRADLVRRGDLGGPGVIVSAVGTFFWMNLPPVSHAAAFLRRAIPWVSRAQLTGGLDVLAHAASKPEQRALLDALREELADWSPAGEPPVKVPVTIAEPTPADEAAWIASALALARHRRGSLLELLGQCLSTMQVAAVQEVSTGLSPRAAMQFFAEAAPGHDPAALLALLEPLIPGYDHPRVRRFTTGLADLLRARIMLEASRN